MLAHVWATVHVHVLPCMYATQGHCVGVCSYIRSECGNCALSVCDVNGRKHTTGFVIVPARFYVLSEVK